MNNYDKQLKEALAGYNNNYIVWYTGSRDQADYIIKYSKKLQDNALALPLPDNIIKGHSEILSSEFLEYFFLDFPDVIISKKADIDKLPIMGIEILEQKPVGWNHTQRFSRAAASLISDVPFAYLMPQQRYMFDEYKGKGEADNIYNIGGKWIKENLRKEFQLLFSIYKLSDIHQVPCLAFFWPITEEYKFLSEGLLYNDDPELRWKQLPPGPVSQTGAKFKEISALFQFIDLVIDYYEKNIPVEKLMKEDLVQHSLGKIDPRKTTLYTEKHIKLKNPDKGNIKIAYSTKTSDFIKRVKALSDLQGNYLNEIIDSKYFKEFLSRPYSIVVEITSDPLKKNRGFSDPYSGVVASFDYRYCREITKGKNIHKRDYNLIFMPTHENATRFFEKIITTQLREIETTDSLRICWKDRKNIKDTLDITKNLFLIPPFMLKKELKNFFYFADLIITPENLFLGKNFIN